MSRRASRRVVLLARCLLAAAALDPEDAVAQDFLNGWNHPWAGYGTDFGSNAWGHSGLSSSGWSPQRHPTSQGFVSARRTVNGRCGVPALRIGVALQGQHPNRRSGEVELSVTNHPPQVGSRRAPGQPLNLDGVEARVRIWFPPGSAGNPSAPNGVQLVFKTRLSDSDYPSLYTLWQNIDPSWEGTCRDIVATVDNTGPAAVREPGFDARSVSLVGVKLGINDLSASTIDGTLDLEPFAFNTARPMTYDLVESEIERDFGTVTRSGRNVTRIWLFGDGRASPEFDASGSITGLQPSFFDDFDELLRAAQAKNVRVMPVLLDFLWFAQAHVVSGVTLGGHSDVIRDPAKRQTFLDNVLGPFLTRFGSHPAIHSIDIINEPEWAMAGVSSTPLGGLDPVTVSEMQEFVRECVQYIHEHSDLLVTVGAARRMWLTYWEGLGLDLYQFHWYDHFANTEPFPWPPASELTLDKPVIVGEVPTASTGYAVEAFEQAARAGGYAGLFLWSFRAGDVFSNLPLPSNGPGRFSKTAPAADTTSALAVVSFSWTASESASSYEVCVDRIFNTSCDNLWVTAGNATTLATTLEYGATYYWQVRSINPNGRRTEADAGMWWRLTTGPAPAMAAISTSPNSGAGMAQVFTLRYSDSAGAANDLSSARVRFSVGNSTAASCTFRYSAITGAAALLDDAGAVWLPGTMGIGTIANQQCTVNLAASTAAPSGANLTLAVSISFRATFAGLKNISMMARSAGGVSTGWQPRGTWSVPLPVVNAIAVTPNGGTGSTQLFTLEYSDSAGAGADLSSARVRFSAGNVAAGSCTVRYNAITGAVGLLDDAGVAWLPGTLGSGTLANRQCTINLASSAATVAGANLTLALSVTFKHRFAGSKAIHMMARSAAGPTTGWLPRGTWTVPALTAAHSAIPSAGSGPKAIVTYARSLAHALQIAFDDAEDRVRDVTLLVRDEFHPPA